MQTGDIHPNPGPDSTSTVHEDSLSSDILTNHLSIFHLNIQSLLPKIDSELNPIVFSETWLKPNISDTDIGLLTTVP